LCGEWCTSSQQQSEQFLLITIVTSQTWYYVKEADFYGRLLALK